MNKRQKFSIKVIIIIVLIIILLLSVFRAFWFWWDTYIDLDNMEYLKLAWKIEIAEPKKIDYIFTREYPEGEDLEIWYYEEYQIEEIAKNKSFKKIDENAKALEEILKEYVEILDSERKELFDSYVNIEDILDKNNYFAYETEEFEEASYILLILDCDTGKMYYFTNIY